MSGKFTPGPWEWWGYADRLNLATVHSGKQFVMGFKRHGMNGAEPTFQVSGRMVPASELFRFEVGPRDVVGMTAAKANPDVYRYDIRDIDHPDAHLISAAPRLYAALERLTYYINGINESGEHAPTPDEMADANRQAQAALSAARGEAPGAEG